MFTFVTVVHVILCVFMIFVILLQPGKDAGMGSALGGGAATSAFGGRGAVTFLSKLTGVCAALFFITSLGLSFVGMRTSVVGVEEPAATSTPTPGAGSPVDQTQQAAPQDSAPAQQEAPASPAPQGGTPTPQQ